MGRRWGKTFLGGDVALACAHRGATVGWVAPTYKNSLPLWRWVQPYLAPLREARLVATNKTEMVIDFQYSRGMLGFFSGDNADSMRGWSFHVLMLDEAARLREDVWQEVLQPTLADYDGVAYLISTPKGRNWFWREFQAADGQYQARWKAPSCANPHPKIRQAYQTAQTKIPERTFLQEWNADFVEDSGQVFRRVSEAATATPHASPLSDHQYVFGIDFGKHEDFTVIAILDVTSQSLVAIERFNQIDYQVQMHRIRAAHALWQPVAIIAEVNSMGEPILEALQRDDLPIRPFRTTNATKATVIEALALAFEQGDIHILPAPVLLDELQSFALDRLPSGMIRYSAPSGLHDDCVMALAFAWHGAQSASGSWGFV